MSEGVPQFQITIESIPTLRGFDTQQLLDKLSSVGLIRKSLVKHLAGCDQEVYNILQVLKERQAETQTERERARRWEMLARAAMAALEERRAKVLELNTQGDAEKVSLSSDIY
jgi:hypothetical protein